MNFLVGRQLSKTVTGYISYSTAVNIYSFKDIMPSAQDRCAIGMTRRLSGQKFDLELSAGNNSHLKISQTIPFKSMKFKFQFIITPEDLTAGVIREHKIDKNTQITLGLLLGTESGVLLRLG